jgi:hypothetical protein
MALCAMLLGAGAALAHDKHHDNQKFPATGQTTVYAVGDDGSYQAGAPLKYKNNCNGTITDQNTGLMWEVKDDYNGSPNPDDLNDVNNNYPCAGTCSTSEGALCGTAADCPTGQTCNASDGQSTGYTIFQWVAQLNAKHFAGHKDWRIPNVKELESIVDYGTYPPPDVAAAFNTNCAAACTVTTCSCTQSNSNYYWSATTNAGYANFAWDVGFGNGNVNYDYKPFDYKLYVRAVRSGL